MKKRAIALIMICLLLFSCSLTAWAGDTITVLLNGNPVTFTDQSPVIVNDRTLVPLRDIFEQFGCYVHWSVVDDMAYAARATQGKMRMIQLYNGSSAMRLADLYYDEENTLREDKRSVILDVPAQIINDRIMVPLRAIGEALDAGVEWNGETQTVSITYNADSVITVSDQECREHLQKTYVKIQDIFIKGGFTEEGKRKADEVVKKLEGGADFQALMYEYSEDPGMLDAPEGYIFTAGECPDIETDAFALQTGDYTVVETVPGYHIIKRVPLTEEDYQVLVPEVKLEVLLIRAGF